MITAFDVYLVMQADSIAGCFAALTALACLALISITCYVMSMESYTPDDIKAKGIKNIKIAGVIAAFSVIAATACPSSKTLAAMYIVPALTSEKTLATLGPEVKELYALLKAEK